MKDFSIGSLFVLVFYVYYVLMGEALTDSYVPAVHRVNPEDLAAGELEAMQSLYSHDAVEAYQAIVDDENTKDALKAYFACKARQLPINVLDANQKFWIVKRDDVIGMAGYNIERQLIHSVYISQDARSQGLGTILMNSVIQDTNTASPSHRTVQVARTNVKALDFYTRLGFRLTGRSKDWNIGDATIPEIEMAI